MTVEGSASNATVVYLLNFLAPDVIAITQAWNQKVGKLIVLISVAMEGNRSWAPDDGGLDVREQRTWTRTRIDRHPGGYEDVNYVHFPLDTMSQLRRAKPEVVVSAELGMRSMLSAAHCTLSGWFGLRHRRCKLVLAVSTSPWIESSRSGRLRRIQRRWLLRCADRVTYHGPECQQWLLDLGVSADRLAPFQYAADPTKIYRDELQAHASDQVRVVTVGQLIDRKGVREGLRQMIEVASSNPTLRLQWTLVGGGPLLDEIQSAATPANLTVRCLGNCTAEQIRDAYRDHEVMFFPTRGDEWGLVVDEALHSGLVVIGNPRAQAVGTLVKDGVNGWICPVDDTASLGSALTTFSVMSGDERMTMREQARSSVSDRTPEHAADQITAVIDQLLEHQSGDSSRH
ncbi:glycosyltransferase family 4 protein [Rhodopirellula sp. JC740]|uniref:Glycosyltransferase family 4 protein n=1 Tax=Rhodopirellula halodulae TaxID=2894198 RepID=A0ABS8NDA6_9BACT|nr:glycosyltransferase family 4 protein [Rhodopirellula sp. JC740]MCC9641528.1 glycosyltransferase family 4 protein [Rhodopirellula sp. JC740]